MPRKTSKLAECTRFFLSAANHRLNEASWIIENSSFTTAGVYLAGYAVECSLKAVLLSCTPKRQHADVKRSFRTKTAHDYDWLRRQLLRKSVVIPKLVIRNLGTVQFWNTALRYQSSQIEPDEANDFVSATQEIVEWAARST